MAEQHPTQFTDDGERLIPPLRHSPDVVSWLTVKYPDRTPRQVRCQAPGCTRYTTSARGPEADSIVFCSRECWERLRMIIRPCVCGRAVVRVTDTAMVHSVCSDPCAELRETRFGWLRR
jgi:hypothetical protein